MLIIDCHAHIYSPDEDRYPPKDQPLRVPGGKASIDDLRKTSVANGVTAVRAVQTVSFYGYDNRYLCDATKANPNWVSGVCTVDIFLMQLEWVESAEKLLKEFPHVIVGFDHCMDLKPGPQYEKKLDAVLQLSEYKNLYPKVDFISTGTEIGYPGNDLHEAAMKIIDTYGPERCVWGSNFPNVLWTPKMTYAEHLKIFTDELPLKEKARAQVLGETARRLWFPRL